MIGIRKLSKLLGFKEKALKQKLQSMNVLHTDNTITDIGKDIGIAGIEHNAVYHGVEVGINYGHNVFDADRIGTMIVNGECLPAPELKAVELPF